MTADKAPVTPDDEGTLVLVVDDYQDAREMYAEYLTFSGFRVAEAANGADAVQQAIDLSPDIILMDLSLPGMDGWEATRRIKLDARTKHIPIIALTGHALPGVSTSAKDAGCDAFIIKPCLPDAVVSEVRRLLKTFQKKNHRRRRTSHA
jgi:two-component system cell cycle response regulator DivK